MRAFEEFRNMDQSFWAFVKFTSEKLGYSVRGANYVKGVKGYSPEEINWLCRQEEINASAELIHATSVYSCMRADMLNDFVESHLMDAETAHDEYMKWEQLHRIYHYQCKLPLNKQKGEMKQVAFFTAIINILAEKTIKEELGIRDLGFDDDPRSLMYMWDENRNIIGATSRRFDGAFPSIENPLMVWEIKEYYYATTFGSRVADGVYETQLDGFEFNEIANRTGRKVYHVLFIDAYRTWWIQGKSYLCRIVDAINSGIVDEVIVGSEVLSRWPELLREVIRENYR
jgi:hypothetical protein